MATIKLASDTFLNSDDCWFGENIGIKFCKGPLEIWAIKRMRLRISELKRIRLSLYSTKPKSKYLTVYITKIKVGKDKGRWKFALGNGQGCVIRFNRR